MLSCLFFDVVYIICKAKNKNIIGLFAKVLAAFCFITIGYFGYVNTKTAFSYYILIGLILDGIGDLFLAFRNIFAKNVNFFIGGVSFLAGHILFLRALLFIQNEYLLACIVLSAIIGPILFFFFKRVCRFGGALNILGITYLIIIIMMLCFSMGIYLTTPTLNHFIFMLGATLFVSSDIILVLYNFSKKDKWMHPLYSLLYFIAQILISFSLHI